MLKVADEIRFESTDTLAKQYDELFTVLVSSRTVRICLPRNKIRNYFAVSKPFFSSTNMLKRIEWANNHKNWTNEQSYKVVFSDECTFTVRLKTAKERVWRKSNTRFNPRNTVPTFQSGFISLCVRGVFSAVGQTQLVRTEGMHKQYAYKTIIKIELIPFGIHHYGSSCAFTFQKDNSSPHKAKSVKAFLDANGINVIKWPPQSPDINPIENSWSFLERKLRDRSKHPETLMSYFMH